MPFPRTLALISFHLALAPLANAQDALPPLAPDRLRTAPQYADNEARPIDAPASPDAIQPIPATTVLPPQVPPRLMPTPNLLPSDLSSTTPVKPPLAWRAKALQLRQSTTAINRRLRGTYDAILMALITRLPQYGYHVEVLNSKGGEVLAAPADPNSKQRIILVVNELPTGTVTVKAMPLIQGKQTNDIIQQLLLSTSADNDRRGTL